jgi:1-acyl-sn-glycerol-3-phosphate acyltransferase
LHQLQPFVFEIDSDDTKILHDKLYVPQPLLKKVILFIPAAAGLLLHAPLYLPVKKLIKKASFDTDHFDAVMTGVLMLLYPFYVAVFTVIVFAIFNNPFCFLLILILPFTAWAFVQLKKQLD